MQAKLPTKASNLARGEEAPLLPASLKNNNNRLAFLCGLLSQLEASVSKRQAHKEPRKEPSGGGEPDSLTLLAVSYWERTFELRNPTFPVCQRARIFKNP